MLDKESLADQSQHRAALPGRPAVSRKFGREKLDNVEDRINFAFVAAERDAFGERVGDNEETLRRKIFMAMAPPGGTLSSSSGEISRMADSSSICSCGPRHAI